MRNYVSTLLLESAMDSITGANALLGAVATAVTSPTVPIVEEDCGTLLGEAVATTYSSVGLTELENDTVLTRGRINTLRSLGKAEVDVRSLRTCISEGGICRACFAAGRPRLGAIPPAFGNVKLLMHAEGTAGSQTYTDSSNYVRTITGGPSTTVTAGRFFQGTSSLEFTAGVPLTVPPVVSDADEWASLGTDTHPMTLELAVYYDLASSGGADLTGDGPGPGFWWGFAISAGGTSIDLYEDDYSPSASVPFLAPLVTGQFYAIAIQMTGTTHRQIHVWLDGQYQGTATSTRTPVTTNAPGATPTEKSLHIGRSGSATSFVGNIDEVRISEQVFLPVGGSYSLASGAFPDTTITGIEPVGSRVRIDPELFLAIGQVSVPYSTATLQLEFTPDQYDFLYLYRDGGLISPTAYTISGSVLSFNEVLVSPGPVLADYVIKYVVISRVSYYYWLISRFSGALLGAKALPSRPMPLKKALLLDAIPEQDLEALSDQLESTLAGQGDFVAHLKQIKDPLEKALFAILLGSIFLN